MAESKTSTGRGGAGNIGQDPQVYTDGSIVREGEGKGTTGRGGYGNTESPRLAPQDAPKAGSKASPAIAPNKDKKPEIMVPDVATTTQHQSDFHTGRGGRGNEHRDKYGGHSTKEEQDDAEKGTQGLVGKLKKMLGLAGKKDGGAAGSKGKEKETTEVNGTS